MEQDILPGEQILLEYALQYLEEGGINDVIEFAKWLDKNVDASFGNIISD